MTRVVIGSFDAATHVIIPPQAFERAEKILDAERMKREAVANEAEAADALRVRNTKRARLVGRLRRRLAALTKGDFR
jgi:hypothetical protein